jgi:hypothetical protein
VFVAHSAVEGSGAWPLLWPVLGGAVAALSYAADGRPLPFRTGAGLGLRAGLVAGLLFVVGGVALIYGSETVTLGSRLGVLAVGMLVGVASSVVGAGAATVLVRLR